MMRRRWLVIEDWTRGKYPEGPWPGAPNMGAIRVFRRCWTQRGAQSLADYLNTEFLQVALSDGRLRPNAEYRVLNEVE